MKRTWFSTVYHSTDAEWRAWAQGVVDTLKSFGLTQTADSGQLADPVVATRPAASASGGYLIFRTNDAAHSVLPLYFKFELGTYSNANTPFMWITIGSGSDGAGAITGPRTARTFMGRGTTPTNGTVYEHAAGSGDGFFWMYQAIGSGIGTAFYFERGRDTDGDPTDTYAVFYGESPSNNGNWWTIPRSGATTVFTTSSGGVGLPVLYAAQGVNEIQNVAGEVPVYPLEPFLGRRQSPLLGMAIVCMADVGPGVILRTTMYGEEVQFRRVSDGVTKYVRGAGTAYGSVGTLHPALAGRWEDETHADL
jgi:hypothetical protein